MYVLQVPDFLAMVEAEPHQELKATGLVFEFHGSSAKVAAFVSHQWAGLRHADPEFRQLCILQGMFREAVAGSLHVDPFAYAASATMPKATVGRDFLRTAMSWVMWWDYFSVPQPEARGVEPEEQQRLQGELLRAVASLPLYVDSCAVFLVLAPSVRHEAGHLLDYRTWRGRGWCRLERLARSLSLGGTAALLVKRTDTVFELGAHDYLMEPVGAGAFGTESDRAELEPIVRRLVTRKLQALLHADLLEDYRHLLAWCSLLAQGTQLSWKDMLPSGVAACDGDVLGNFSRLLRLDAPSPVAILVASGLGDTGILEALIQARADVACEARRSVPRWCVAAGQQPIHVAAQRGRAEAVAVLVRHRASVDATCRVGQTPLCFAASSDSCAAVELLLRLRSDLQHRTRAAMGALETAIVYGRQSVIPTLLARGARPISGTSGFAALHNACAYGAGADIVERLVLSRALLEDRFQPPPGSTLWVIMSLLTLPHRLGRRSFLSMVAHHSWGATPLMTGVMNDSAAEVQALLRLRADATARNRNALDVRQLSALFKSEAHGGVYDL